MPILDGLGSTARIRNIESTATTTSPPITSSPPSSSTGAPPPLPSHPSSSSSAIPSSSSSPRVPIFAVSASLVEKHRQSYIDAGFDAWILKPINFSSLALLLRGIVDSDSRRACLYAPGQWEGGGWFSMGDGDSAAAHGPPTSTESGEMGS